MRIITKILNGIAEVVKGFLNVENPILSIKPVDEFLPLIRVAETVTFTAVFKHPCFPIGLEVKKKLTLELF